MQLSIRIKYSLMGLAAGISIVGLYLLSVYNYLLFHGIVEFFSIVIIFGMFAIAWNSRKIMNNSYFLFLAVASLFVGGFTLIHTLAYKGMGVFPEYGANLPTQLWIVMRYMLSLSFFSAVFFTNRKFRLSVLIGMYVIASTVILGSIFFWGNFPQAYIDGVGLTQFKVGSEYVISFIFLFTIGLMFRKRGDFSPNIFKLVIVAMSVAILSELAFTLYTDVYGISNMAGHLLNVVSFYIIYRALIETGLKKPYDLLFHDLKRNEILLKNHADAMTKINDDLLYEIDERKKAEEALKKSEEVTRNRARELERIQSKLEEKASEVEEYATQMEQLAEERASKLRDSERLAAIGATAGMIGHDIRNPLQGIDGALFLAKQSVISSSAKGEEKKELIEELDLIDEQVKYIDHMVADLQHFAKKPDLQLKEVNIQQLIIESLAMAQIPKNVKVNNISGNDFKVTVDPEQMKRVFINLIDNAHQAMPNGGTLTITTSKNEDNFMIEIEDTGVGIPKEIESKIFTPLFTTKSKGQGFGLPVCKKLVEAQGGEITVKSEEEKGTIFTIQIPLE